MAARRRDKDGLFFSLLLRHGVISATFSNPTSVAVPGMISWCQQRNPRYTEKLPRTWDGPPGQRRCCIPGSWVWAVTLNETEFLWWKCVRCHSFPRRTPPYFEGFQHKAHFLCCVVAPSPTAFLCSTSALGKPRDTALSFACLSPNCILQTKSYVHTWYPARKAWAEDGPARSWNPPVPTREDPSQDVSAPANLFQEPKPYHVWCDIRRHAVKLTISCPACFAATLYL